MFQIKTEREKKIQVSVKLPESLYEKLQEHCEAWDMTMAQAIRNAVRDYLIEID